MNSHATDSRIPCRNRKPSTSPTHMMTAVVTTIRTASAASLDSRPDARCTGKTHNRDSKPVSALTHDADRADDRAGHGSDHRDERDAAVKSAVPGDLRNTVPQHDVQCSRGNRQA